MLELNKIRWSEPDGEEIIKGISLCIAAGKLTVITGPNGGGKTSIAKLAAGLLHPSEGKILLDGADMTEADMTERARRGIAYAFQQPVYFKGLTVRDLLEIAAEGTLSRDKLCGILDKAGLCSEEYIDRPMDGRLSGGESKRIELATVLARKQAKVLIFDEPEAGIDLWSFANLVQTFQTLKKERESALLVISHQKRILEIADHIVVIADGRIQIAGGKEFILPRLLHKEKQSRCPIKRNRKGAVRDE